MDYTIKCYECDKLLRRSDDVCVEDIHTNSKGEDVCHECCNVCGYNEHGVVTCNSETEEASKEEQHYQETVGFGAW